MNKNTSASWSTVFKALLNMVFIAAVAYLFNFMPEKVGIFRSATDLDTFTPLLAPAFADYLPGLNLWWGLAFSFHVALLATKRWTPALRWAQMALGFLGAILLARIALAAPFLASEAGSAAIRYSLAVVIVALVFTSARQLYRLVNSRRLVFGTAPAPE